MQSSTSPILTPANGPKGSQKKDPRVSDDGVEIRYVMPGLGESGGYGSIEVHGIIDLQDDEGAGWTDSKAGETFIAGMRRVADCRNHVGILTGQVDR